MRNECLWQGEVRSRDGGAGDWVGEEEGDSMDENCSAGDYCF